MEFGLFTTSGGYCSNILELGMLDRIQASIRKKFLTCICSCNIFIVYSVNPFKYWDWLGWNVNTLFSYAGSETEVPCWIGFTCWYIFFHLSSSSLCYRCEKKREKQREKWTLLHLLRFPQLVGSYCSTMNCYHNSNHHPICHQVW